MTLARVLFGWIVLASGLVQAAEPPTLVVAPLRAIDAAGGASEIISEQIRAYVGRSGLYTLVSPEEMDALDAELARQLSGGCNEASCVAQLGGALGARYLLTGSLGLIGKTYVLNLKLIDIETASAKANAKPIMASSLDEIVRRVDEASADVLGVGKAPAAAATAARPAAPASKAARPAVPAATPRPSAMEAQTQTQAPSVTRPNTELSTAAKVGIGVAVVAVVVAVVISTGVFASADATGQVSTGDRSARPSAGAVEGDTPPSGGDDPDVGP